MVSLIKNKLNLFTSIIGGGKTITALNLVNQELDNKGDIIYVTLDDNVTAIKKIIHCLYNDVNLINIKHEKDDVTPIGLDLPNNFHVIDGVFSLESIKMNIRELTLGKAPTAIFIDPINFISDFSDKTYKEKLESIFLELDGMAEFFQCPIIGTLTVLGVTDFKSDFFKFKDGGMSYKITRLKETKFQISDYAANEKMDFALSFKNIKLSEIDTSLVGVGDEETGHYD